MILEQYFHRDKDLKSATAWQKAMATREIQKNSYRVSGDLKQAKAFASAVMTKIEHPKPVMQLVEAPEEKVKPIVIFSKDMLAIKPAALAA
jgi:hypothetical protein